MTTTSQDHRSRGITAWHRRDSSTHRSTADVTAGSSQTSPRSRDRTTPPGAPRACKNASSHSYRYGHGQIRETYLVDGDLRLPLFPDLMGFRPVAHDLDWATAFDLPGGSAAQRSRRLDGSLPQSLIHLPVQITGDVSEDAYHSLAARDLQRGVATGLPSGEAVARAVGAEPLAAEEGGLRAPGRTAATP